MKNTVEKNWMERLPDDGREFAVHGRNKGEEKYWIMDILKPAFVESPKDATWMDRGQVAEVIPQMLESWKEMDWKVKDADGNEYLDSIVLEKQAEQAAAERKPEPYGWIEGGSFYPVDETAMQSALNVGIEVNLRDFAIGLPPTARRIAIGLSGAIVNPNLDKQGFTQMLRDNGYDFDSKAVDGMWKIRNDFANRLLSLNEMVGVIERSIADASREEVITVGPAGDSEVGGEAGSEVEEEEKTPYRQIKDAVDAVRKEADYKGDIGKLATRLTDDQLTAAIDYVQRYKGRKKVVKTNLGNIARQVQNVIDERYNAKHPTEAEQQAYAKTIEYLKQGKGMGGFNIDDYIRSHERERDEARSKGLNGWAAVQQGVLRAAWDTRKEWNAERQHGLQQEGAGRNGNVPEKQNPLMDLIGYMEKGPENKQGISGLERFVKAVDDVRLNLAISYAEGARNELGKDPVWFGQVMGALREERNGRLQEEDPETVEDWAYRCFIKDADGRTQDKEYIKVIPDSIIYAEQVIKEAEQAGLSMEAAWKKGELKALAEAQQRQLKAQEKVQPVESESQASGNKISFFRMNNGYHGINETINGVRSATRRVSEEDVEWYFKDLKGAGTEEVNRRRAILADKYLHTQHREQAQDMGGKEGKTRQEEKYVLPPVSTEVRSRLTDAKVFQMRDGLNYAVRCKIDGEQQCSKVLSKRDISAFFDHYSGQTAEFRAERQTQVAALYFQEELSADIAQEQERGMKR